MTNPEREPGMNPILVASRKSSERTRFLERIAARSGSSILVALAALELSVAVTFMAGGVITRYHFLLFVAVLLATCVCRDRVEVEPLWRVGAASLVLSLLVVFASFVLAGSTLDLSPDGQSAQMLRISHLASGWNPVYDAEFIDHLADDRRVVTIPGGQHNSLYLGRKIEHVDSNADIPITLC